MVESCRCCFPRFPPYPSTLHSPPPNITIKQKQGDGGEGEDVDEDKVLDEEMGVRVEFDRDEEEEEEESDLDEVVDEEDEEVRAACRVLRGGCALCSILYVWFCLP
jgi:hypothetical protein